MEDGTLNFPGSSQNNFLFLLTDAKYKDFDDTDEEHAQNHYSMNSWIEKFCSSKVKVTVVTQDYYKSDYEDLYTKTGGNFIDINSDDYYKLMLEYSEYIDSESIPDVKITVTENPYTTEMPESDLAAKAVFKPAEKSAYTITVITSGHGDAYASQSTAYGGEVIRITAKPAPGYVLESVTCTKGGAVLNGNSFVMPESDVVICVSFNEDTSKYLIAARPYSYVFSYDSEMNLIKTNSNLDFDNYPEYVSVKINLGAEYAGRTGNICTGRKSDSNVIETVTLDNNGCYVFKAEIKKNYSFVLED